jgi:hypothetical protein
MKSSRYFKIYVAALLGTHNGSRGSTFPFAMASIQLHSMPNVPTYNNESPRQAVAKIWLCS